ncbi:transcriptional regulator [Scytonema hofmannii PCC 7110]|uniref:Transcriptional regulator n=1 Tax=Scytonema hofmannii PCC 7110 TaxID=128403 RepID=A0A139XFY9_9CYAN|nr:ATP-binding protein [Scytonema hofmannii]KYC43583.1 transcriptional regulator [Scytonema hofmannii PCC 7110]
MNDEELEVLLKDLESDRVERKASISDKGKLCEAVCAFANDLPNHQKPGVLFIGVRDDGNCANLIIDDKLLLTLSAMRSDGNILPFPTMIVQKRTIGGCELAVVIVEPSDAPPVRFNGRVWVRVGPRRATATAEEERRLAEKRRSKDLPFDLQPLASASLNNLNIDLFYRVYLTASLATEIIEENQRSVEQQLMALRFATVEPLPKPTILGLLVVGNNPRQFVPCAYIQFLRIDGSEFTDPIKDQKEISSALPNLLEILDETLQSYISVVTDITASPIEVRQPDYPIVALQQLARNAVLHRTYEGTNAPVRISWFNDRIEIQNPGSPFGQVNRQNFGQPGITDYRNPHLAEAMKNLGYVQRFGIGIQLARQQLQKNGNPPPEFFIDDSYVIATVRKRL